MESDFANINNVAMAAAFSLVINCYFCLYKKWNISILLALPSILVVFASGTRKAVFMIIAGLFILVIVKQILRSKNAAEILGSVFVHGKRERSV